jgi:hypothetical protein
VEFAEDFASICNRDAADRPDAVVIDPTALAVPQLIEQLKQAEGRCTPVIVYAPTELDPDDDRRLRLSVFGGLVRMARTMDQLVDQASMLLHSPVETLPAPAKAKLNQSKHDDAVLTGRKVLVIDDDIRNIFSLASALEEYGIELAYAESGRAGSRSSRPSPTWTSSGRHHDARHGRLRDDPRDSFAAGLGRPADRARDRQGDEGRPAEVHPGRRVGLCVQAGGHRPPRLGAARFDPAADAMKLASDTVVSLMPQAS